MGMNWNRTSIHSGFTDHGIVQRCPFIILKHQYTAKEAQLRFVIQANMCVQFWKQVQTCQDITRFDLNSITAQFDNQNATYCSSNLTCIVLFDHEFNLFNLDFVQILCLSKFSSKIASQNENVKLNPELSFEGRK